MANQKEKRVLVDEPRRLVWTRHILVLLRALLLVIFFAEGLVKLTPKYSEELFETRTRLYKGIYTQFYQEWIFTPLNLTVGPVELKEIIGRIHVNVGWSPIVPLLYGAMALIVVVMGQGPKKKVWLSSVAQSSSPENKKND